MIFHLSYFEMTGLRYLLNPHNCLVTSKRVAPLKLSLCTKQIKEGKLFKGSLLRALYITISFVGFKNLEEAPLYLKFQGSTPLQQPTFQFAPTLITPWSTHSPLLKKITTKNCSKSSAKKLRGIILVETHKWNRSLQCT